MGTAIQKYSTQLDPDLCVALLIVDQAGVIRHADPGVEVLLGRGAGQCEGRSLDEAIPSIELLMLMREVNLGVVKRGTIAVALDSPVRRLLLCLTAVRGVGERPMVAIQVASEDNYREEREARAAVRLRTTIESVIAGFAHEVRNPIAAILSITEAVLAGMDPSPPPAASMLVRIPGLVNRVDKLIKESLRYSRPRCPKRSPQRLRALVEWSIELAQMEKGGVDFEVVVDEALDSVLVDAEQIEQVVVNLLCNARDAACTRVRLAASREVRPSARAARVVLEVTDDGRGVPAELHERIFEPFFTTKAHGTGLGLAIARDLARLNGGDIQLYSTSERGSTFSLYLEEHAAPDAPGGARRE
ncbi:MAG: hypothetical protein EPO40_12785 [Myxococcaceae bacterium]|nr:MAG: hypothetical protein EPO40_12785 [Myxococcaceae bacterium]